MDLQNIVYLQTLIVLMLTVLHGLNVLEMELFMEQQKRYRLKYLTLKENTSYQYLNTALHLLLMKL